MPDSYRKGSVLPYGQNQEPLFSFGIFTDVHYCGYKAEGSRYYPKALDKLRDALKSFSDSSPEFLINLGDLIDRDYSSFGPVMNILDSSGLKIFHCLGNHDFTVEKKYKNKFPPGLLDKNGYYTFSYNGFRFLILNGNEISTYYSDNKSSVKESLSYIEALKNEGAINAIDWNGGMSSSQISWLEGQLNSAMKEGEKVFLFCHFPVFPENNHNLLNYKEVLNILGNYNNIIAWFAGHDHAGNYGNFNMIHFVTLKGMIETEDTGSYAVIEVYNNRIWIRGAGREKSQILAY